MSVVSDLFDKVLQLKPGERITIPFKTVGEMKSKKTMLFREKKAYEESLQGSLLRKSIFITQELRTKDNVFKLHLSTTAETMDWLSGAVIVEEGGGVKPLTVSEGKEDEVELLRIRKLRKEQNQ